MRLFLATGTTEQIRICKQAGCKDILVSIVALRTSRPMFEQTKLLKQEGFNVFLDSGAYSIYQQGGETGIIHSLERYIEFLKTNRKHFTHIAALDAIGNPEKSYKNYMIMRKEGLDDVIPAYHRGEPFEWIDKYLSKTDKIGLGGFASNPSQRIQIVRKAVERIKMKEPKTRIHLYGVGDFTSLNLLGPHIESADTTSWLIGERFAHLTDISGRKPFYYQRRISHSRHTSDNYNIYMMLKFVGQINESIPKRASIITQIPHSIRHTKAE